MIVARSDASVPMMWRPRSFAVAALMLIAGSAPMPAQTPPAEAQAPAVSDVVKEMIGAWEISNAARDKTCPVAFKEEVVAGGRKVEFEPPCTAFPSLKGLAVWVVTPNEDVHLLDGKGGVVLEFSEVESGLFEAERKGEGLYFLRSQAAIRAATVNPEQVFGEWTMLQEIDKPLCKLMLSNAQAGEDSYRIVVKPGCTAAIVGLGFATWRIESGELVLVGRTSSWRFEGSDPTAWERTPPSTEPMLLMRK
jgi:hypothetical protein